MKDARALATALADPISTLTFGADDWTSLLSIARAERLDGSLAYRLADLPLPAPVTRALEDARAQAEFGRTQALWEVEMARRALGPLGIAPVLLKGSAFAFAGLPAGVGRLVGDLDILVPRDRLDDVEAALLMAGFEWAKDDAYSQGYYRRWMHELPPLVHRDRGSMIDVHHTILPPTARRTPDAAALIADSIEIAPGLRILSPADMIVHAATHLFADGDLAGGLRNVWDIDRLLRLFAATPDFWLQLDTRARRHEMLEPVALALRLADRLFATPVEPRLAGHDRIRDTLFIRRMLARDGWGRPTRPASRLGFYIRSHWMRMPPLMLARHLWVKARAQ
ncbi:MAG: nucleotidyltransferase family protein [Pseudomonadota bacterium]